jgi:hypothetical protein
VSTKYYVRINTDPSTGQDFIQLPSCSSQQEVEDLCSKLEQFVLASLRGEVRKQVE